MVRQGQMPVGHAEVLTHIDHDRQAIALRIFEEAQGTMSVAMLRKVANDLYEEQSQDNLFSLETFWTTQAVKVRELPRRGKHAVTGAPVTHEIPSPRWCPPDNVGAICDRYIAELQRAGYRREAQAVANLYEMLVKLNYCAVPLDAELLKSETAEPEIPSSGILRPS